MNDLNSVMIEGNVKGNPVKSEDCVHFVIKNDLCVFNVKCFDELAEKAVDIINGERVRIVGVLSGENEGCYISVDHLELR